MVLVMASVQNVQNYSKWQARHVQIEFDVAGRVISTKGRGKAYGDNSGTKFYVDLEKMVQVNLTSGFERKVFRREVDLEKNLSTTRMDIHDSKKPTSWTTTSPFPADLVDQRTGDLKELFYRRNSVSSFKSSASG